MIADNEDEYMHLGVQLALDVGKGDGVKWDGRRVVVTSYLMKKLHSHTQNLIFEVIL